MGDKIFLHGFGGNFCVITPLLNNETIDRYVLSVVKSHPLHGFCVAKMLNL